MSGIKSKPLSAIQIFYKNKQFNEFYLHLYQAKPFIYLYKMKYDFVYKDFRDTVSDFKKERFEMIGLI